jgi:hypothetical protein
MAETASIARTNEDIAQRVEAAFEESLRRYSHSRHMAATDACLDILEALNLREVITVPLASRRRIRNLLEPLPATCRGVLSSDPRTQPLLESIYKVQERLMNLHCPERPALLALGGEDSDG